MTGKTRLRCVGFKPVCRGSLRGFASTDFVDLRMTVRGIGRMMALRLRTQSATPKTAALTRNAREDVGRADLSELLV